MMKTALTGREQEELIEQIAQWAHRLGIGTLVSFVLETSRPAAPLTGNFFIAIAPILRPLSPLPVHDLGLLVQEDDAARKIRERIRQLNEDAPKGDSVAPDGPRK